MSTYKSKKKAPAATKWGDEPEPKPKKKPAKRKPRKFDPNGWVFNVLRRAHSKLPAAIACREAALSEKVGPRGGKRYDCAHCGGDFALKDTEVDHIDPVVPYELTTACMTMEMKVERFLYNERECLCKECHRNIKTANEAKLRAEWRKKEKFLVVRIKGGSLIKTYKVVNIKEDEELKRWDILSFWHTMKEAKLDCLRRKAYR